MLAAGTCAGPEATVRSWRLRPIGRGAATAAPASVLSAAPPGSLIVTTGGTAARTEVDGAAAAATVSSDPDPAFFEASPSACDKGSRGPVHTNQAWSPMRQTQVRPVPRMERRGGPSCLRSRGRALRGAGNDKKEALPDARPRRASSAWFLATFSRRRRSYSLSGSGSASQQHSRRETP